MKKDLFSEKLRNYEKQPSELAWKRIEARLAQSQRVVVVPLWRRPAVAASVALLLGMAFVFYQKISPNSEKMQLAPTLAQQKSIPTINQTTPTSATSSMRRTAQKDSPKPIVVEGNLIPQVPDILPLVSTGKEVAEELAQMPLEKSTSDQPSTALSTSGPTPSVPSVSEKPAEPKEGISIAAVQKKEAVYELTIPVEEGQPANVLAEASDADENDAESSRKRFRMGGFFRQLKRAATGRRIDWEDVGLSPNRLVARTEAQLERGRERAKRQ
jgi:hypothetical protein